jgi:hypothetical protein
MHCLCCELDTGIQEIGGPTQDTSNVCVHEVSCKDGSGV